MTNVYDFPIEWKISSQRYALRSMNQAPGTSWGGAGGGISGPHTQIWTAQTSMAPVFDPELQDVDAFIARLRGRANVVRFPHLPRWAPWHDRNLVNTVATFSDGSTFTDGSGFISGSLPPEVYLVNAAAAGTRYIVLGGLPASKVKALRAGDLLQIKPNGIPGTVPHLYKAMYGGDTDVSGQIGLDIEPGLRQGVAAGDVVSLRYPSSLFRLVDDNQGEEEVTGGGLGTLGFSLIEALDLVP